MQGEKLIQITKKDGSKHLVPAGQRTTYENFNARAKKLRREKDIVTIEDYEEPAAEAKTIEAAPATTPTTDPSADAGKKGPLTAVEVIDLINKANSPEEITVIVGTDTRVSVLKAAEAKTTELTK